MSIRYTLLGLLLVVAAPTFGKTDRKPSARDQLMRWITPEKWIDQKRTSTDPDKDAKSQEKYDTSIRDPKGDEKKPNNSEIVFNPNALKNSGDGNSGQSSYDKIGDRGGAPPPMSGQGQSASGEVAFDKWWPACVFIDPSQAEKGNAMIKGIVDFAAQCHVNYVVFPITIRQDYSPNNDVEINAKQRISCNLGEFLGVPKWSTQVAGSGTEAPARMCKSFLKDPQTGQPTNIPDTGVAGCAELGGGTDSAAFAQGNYATAPSSGPMVSILQPSGANKVVSMHEIGHNHGFVNEGEDPSDIKVNLGLAIKGPRTGSNTTGPAENNLSSNSPGYTPQGCAFLRNAALNNDGRWTYDAQRTEYYTPEYDPQYQHPLGQKYFDRDTPPGPNPPIILAGADPRKFDNSVIEFNVGATKNDSGTGTQGNGLDAFWQDTRHKKRPGSAAADALLASAKAGAKRPTPTDEDGSLVGDADLESGGNADNGEIVFNERASKIGEDSSSSSGGKNFDPKDMDGGAAGETSEIVFADSAVKGDTTGGGSQVRSVGRDMDRDISSFRDAVSDVVGVKGSDRGEESDEEFFKKRQKEQGAPAKRVKGSALRGGRR